MAKVQEKHPPIIMIIFVNSIATVSIITNDVDTLPTT